jgi:peptidoglycan/xylan/chitin deacetylase (PgdA/CDA1 family)
MSTELTIVMYHYVRNFKTSRYPNIKGLEYTGFLNQIDYLSRNYTIVRMEDVVDAQRSGAKLPENAALLTFDDGYAEHYDLVFPALHDRKLQGSFFAPVEPVRDAKLLDVNRVHFVLASCDDPARLGSYIDEQVEARREQLNLDEVSAYRAKWAIANRFDDAETIYVKRMLQTALPEAFRNEIAAALFAQYVSNDEAAFASELYITRDQAKLMQSSGMYFGSHGFSHYWLNQIPRETQIHEVDSSLEFLRDIGSPVDDFWVMCYPFGGWNDGLLDVLNSRQCTLGLTTEVATADLVKHAPLTLPRYDTNDFPQ